MGRIDHDRKPIRHHSRSAWPARSPGAHRVKAQEPGKSNDEALDSLLEKLSEPGAKTKKAETSAGKPAKDANQRPKSEAAKKAGTSKPKPDSPAQAKTAAKQAGKPAKPSSPGSSDVSSKDKELDQLLEKLGETHDEPAAEDRAGGVGRQAKMPSRPSPRPARAIRRRRSRSRRQAAPDSRARIKNLMSVSRSSPARNEKRIDPTSRRGRASSARSSRKCATWNSAWASLIPAKTPRASRSKSSSRSRP